MHIEFDLLAGEDGLTYMPQRNSLFGLVPLPSWCAPKVVARATRARHDENSSWHIRVEAVFPLAGLVVEYIGNMRLVAHQQLASEAEKLLEESTA